MIVCIAAVPASFPLAIMHHRMRSIAVMNQLFAVYVNHTGNGHSGCGAGFSPTGETIAQLGEGEETRECTIEIADVMRWRSAEPTLVHRRPELYRQLAEPVEV